MEHVNKVLNAGAGVNEGINVLNEALIGAAKHGQLEMLIYLVNKGADVNTSAQLQESYGPQTTSLT